MIYTPDNVHELKGSIKAVVFDFGGVLLQLQPEDSFTELAEVLEIPLNVDDFDLKKYAFFHAFEKGEIRFETFLWNLQRLATGPTPHARPLINAWNAMLKGWKKDKLDLLYYLQDKIDTYLLSNTNELHLKCVYADLSKQHEIEDFDTRFFKKTYYSHKIGMRKPNEDIFNYVWDDIGLPKAETLFIDDNRENAEKASALGINVVLHPRNAALDYLKSLV